MRSKLLLATTLLALAAVPPATAPADDAIGEVVNNTPIAGWGGWAAWSRQEGSRFRLVLRAPDGTISDARIPSQGAPFDVSLGPDVDARVNAVYIRNGDVRRYIPSTRRDEALRDASSPRFDESTPAIYGARVAFTREIGDCQVPFLKTLGSKAPSKRLLRGKCLSIDPGHLALRGTRVATSGIDFSGEEDFGTKLSEIRVYSARGSKVVARNSWAEEPNLFGQIALDEQYVSSVRHGIGALHTFLRVKASGGKVFETRANLSLSGSFAKSSSGTMLYLESQDDENFEQCSGASEVPCRIIRAPRSPFGRAERPLPPQLTVEYVGTPRQSRPLTVRGRLTRRVVQDGKVIRTEPLSNVEVQLRRRESNDEPETFERTPYRGTTGPDGRYEIVIPPPIPREPWFTAVAATPVVATWAGRGTVGTARP